MKFQWRREGKKIVKNLHRTWCRRKEVKRINSMVSRWIYGKNASRARHWMALASGPNKDTYKFLIRRQPMPGKIVWRLRPTALVPKTNKNIAEKIVCQIWPSHTQHLSGKKAAKYIKSNCILASLHNGWIFSIFLRLNLFGIRTTRYAEY